MFTSITPQQAVCLFGRRYKDRISTHIATELEANLILLPTAKGYCCLIGLDTLFSSATFRTSVLDQLPTVVRNKIDELIFVATHTHNAPALDPTKPVLGTIDNDYFQFAAKAVSDLIERSLAGEQTSIHRVLHGSAACSLNAVRRTRGIQISHRYPFIRTSVIMVPNQGPHVPRAMNMSVAYDDAGSPLWAIWTWCCHATSYPNRKAIAADFPGFVREKLRERLGAPTLPIVFLPGFCGDVRPDPSVLPISIGSLLRYPLHRPFARATRRNYNKLCDALTTAIHTMTDSLRPLRSAPIAATARVSLPNDQLLDGASCSGAQSSSDVVTVAMGDFGLLLIGAEVCSPYLAKIGPLLPATWMLSGHADHVLGYLPTDTQIAEGGYESTGFFRIFGLSGAFLPQIERSVLNACQNAIRQAMCTNQQH